MTESYLDERVGRFLDLLARREPTPGGGAAAALTVSLASSLVAMVARYSTSQMTEGEGLVDRAEFNRDRIRHLADGDAHAYTAVLAAFTAAREGRSDGRQVRSALLRAAQVPLEVAEIGAETAQLAAMLAERGKPEVRGDAATALLLAEAGTRAAAHLVAVNVEARASHAASRAEADESRGVDGTENGNQLRRRAIEHVESARAAVASVGTLT